MHLILQTAALLPACLFTSSSFAGQSKIGILVFDGFLSSDVTAPIEVFGAASKKAWFSN